MKKEKKILVLGGDGYLGWPVSLFLSNLGNDIFIIDNYIKRKIANDLKIKPLYPVDKLSLRIKNWNKISNKNINYKITDICDYKSLIKIFKEFQPDTVIHFAEQPSAPYSMMDYKEASFTLKNNLITTLNLIFASKKTNTFPHIIKLGTMGEYGTPNIDIEEGFIDIKHKNREGKFLFPRQGGSLYHTTKIQDTDLLFFYVRAWGLKVTDLMQGPVYGLFTNETKNNEQINTSFYYDSIFGTVLNRFIVQAINGVPLTVYGKGNQKRGYLNIKDTLKCINLAVMNPPKEGELKIFNQFTEVFSVNDLANKVLRASNNLGLKKVSIKKISNPRIEMEDHYYNPSSRGFTDLGLKPIKLDIPFLEDLIRYLVKYKKNIIKRNINPSVKWK